MINGSNEWLDSIKNQVQRLDQLVKSMLQMAKMEEGTLSPVFSDFDLSNAFNEITNPFKTMAQQKGKKLSIHAQQNIHMSGDEGAIRNLISILVDNAIKYSNDGGRIEASLKRDGKFIKIKVRNSSDVKKNENLNLLFERFYRRDTSRSRESGGFGIGLSMAKTIVDSHKGKITAQTENGGYVSFNVTFKGISSPPLLKNKNNTKQSDS
jgi:signal transduction histidine kinase